MIHTEVAVTDAGSYTATTYSLTLTLRVSVVSTHTEPHSQTEARGHTL